MRGPGIPRAFRATSARPSRSSSCARCTASTRTTGSYADARRGPSGARRRPPARATSAGRTPALFNATGVADHPYSFSGSAPNVETSTDPDIATFPRIPDLERALDRLQRVYGSNKRFPVYNTEYGYITHPPNRFSYPSPATAAYYINWTEYLSWRQPRVATTMQYLLYDPTLTAATSSGDGGFASGLETVNGKPKPGYAAYRLPLFLPVTSTGRGRSLEVWGCVRPARYAILGAGPGDAGQGQTVRIQFARGSSGAFTTLRTVTISNANNCYFDVRMKFPGSGTVRLAYTYPNDPLLLFPPAVGGSTVYSRSVAITLR